MRRSPVRHGGDAAEEEVLALVRQHAGELLRFARRFSICADDAQDAYQRALEKLVRRLRGEPPQNVLSWLRTVLRHEALEVRAERERMLSREPHDDERHGGDELTDPAERVERFERLAHTAEALRGLKPQELTALVLRAEGLSYREICERTAWTYTRTNRAITEGRRALRMRLEAIESGAECERWLPLLSLFSDGETTAREVSELRPHLRSCAGCRATLRGFHEAPRQVGALVPVGLLPAAAVATSGAGSGIGRHLEALVHGVLDRASVSVLRVQGAIDALPGAKIAAVAASTVAVAGSGAAIKQAATAGAKGAGVEHVAQAPAHPSGLASGAGASPNTLATAPLGPPSGVAGGPAPLLASTDRDPGTGESEFGPRPASRSVFATDAVFATDTAFAADAVFAAHGTSAAHAAFDRPSDSAAASAAARTVRPPSVFTPREESAGAAAAPEWPRRTPGERARGASAEPQPAPATAAAPEASSASDTPAFQAPSQPPTPANEPAAEFGGF